MLISIAFANSSSHKPSDATVTQVENCYNDYVAALQMKTDSKADRDLQKKADSKFRAVCLTKKFRHDWRKRANTHGADPFLNVQDTLKEWVGSATVQEFNRQSQTGKVIIGAGAEQNCLNFTLDKMQIDSSETCK